MVLVALAASGVLLGAWLLTGFVDRVAARARAQSAADAAALAGVVEGHRRADSLAQANGATLVEFRIDGEMIEVVVELEGVRAVASAELDLVE